MNGSTLSPDQKRFVVLTTECGLEQEEALHALGRRVGGLPEYRKLSRQAQLLKADELTRRGLSLEEARRLVGLPVVDDARVDSSAAGRSLPKSVLPQQTSQTDAECFHCGRSGISLLQVRPGIWLCQQGQKLLKKRKKRDKKKRELASYYNALTRPEFRGLTGIRK